MYVSTIILTCPLSTITDFIPITVHAYVVVFLYYMSTMISIWILHIWIWILYYNIWITIWTRILHDFSLFHKLKINIHPLSIRLESTANQTTIFHHCTLSLRTTHQSKMFLNDKNHSDMCKVDIFRYRWGPYVTSKNIYHIIRNYIKR